MALQFRPTAAFPSTKTLTLLLEFALYASILGVMVAFLWTSVCSLIGMAPYTFALSAFASFVKPSALCLSS